MHYVVYGAGAVGGVIGGRLHRAGLTVTLVARGAHLAAIRATGGLILDAGDGRHLVEARVAAIAADLRAAGIASQERGDILAWKRRKLLLNLGNGVDASFAKGEAADELADRALAEGERVLGAAGATLVSADQDRARRGTTLQRRPDLERRGGSTWQSLRRGTGDSEIDYLSGEIVLQGRLHGVPTPVNEAIVAATRRLSYAGGAPRSLDAAEVLAVLARHARRPATPRG